MLGRNTAPCKGKSVKIKGIYHITTTLVEPERLCFLRTYMVQRYTFFACATQNHPIISRNSLIFILRYMMANKSDEVRKTVVSPVVVDEKVNI